MFGKRKLWLGISFAVLLILMSTALVSAQSHQIFLPLISDHAQEEMIVRAAPINDTTLTPMEQLGKSIFFDQELSINHNLACASCHGEAAGWTGPLSDINEGGAVYEGSIADRFGNRKPPSAAYATLSPIFHMDKKGLFVGGNFWDGRATGEKLGNPAADQAQGPFLNPRNRLFPIALVWCIVCVRPVVPDGYPVSFEEVWGAGACTISWPDDVAATCATEGATVTLSDEDRQTSRYGL